MVLDLVKSCRGMTIFQIFRVYGPYAAQYKRERKISLSNNISFIEMKHICIRSNFVGGRVGEWVGEWVGVSSQRSSKWHGMSLNHLSYNTNLKDGVGKGKSCFYGGGGLEGVPNPAPSL